MGFLENLCKEDNQAADDALFEEYGYILQLSSLHPFMKSKSWRCFSLAFFVLHVINFVYYAVIFSVTAVKMREDPIICLQSVHYSVLFIITLFCLVPLNLCRPDIAKLYRNVGLGFSHYDEQIDEYKKKMKVDMKKHLFIFIIVVYFLFSLNALLITFIGPVLDYYAGLSFNATYSPGGVSLNTPVPSWSPFGTDTTLKLFIATFCEITGALVLGSVFAATNILYMGCVYNLILEIKLLKIALKQLSKRAQRLHQLLHPQNPETIRLSDAALSTYYAMCLKQNAMHYIKIIKCFKYVKKIASYPLFAAYFVGGMIIAFSVIALLFGNDRITPVLSSLALCSLEVLNMLSLSWAGNSVIQASNDLRFSLYDTQWMNLRKQETSSIKIMMTMSQRPLQLLGCGLIPANFRTFSEVMNTAYSYFNVMYAYRSDIKKG